MTPEQQRELHDIREAVKFPGDGYTKEAVLLLLEVIAEVERERDRYMALADGRGNSLRELCFTILGTNDANWDLAQAVVGDWKEERNASLKQAETLRYDRDQLEEKCERLSSDIAFRQQQEVEACTLITELRFVAEKRQADVAALVAAVEKFMDGPHQIVDDVEILEALAKVRKWMERK